ncbi:transcriptional regulator, TetR family [Halobacteriovorax sp. BALOs_7]|uniref:TetR/AcrR family transcriptional regulator n=1 Tax=unclassified Halobacteriovorax TaxID=2639665 RepID=UPI000EA01486|nr:TetR/AcrR family transcriptional regulator [Halobacteriovorax sp. BALOs_7]AYF45104.1 transcriptional regulator, TetR family [Halobacteriovorax sp. BALOs_7]
MKENKTKQNLIDVALPMMAESGVYGVSLRDIAKKAEINVSSVLYHFGSKEEFIATCGEFCVQNLVEAIDSIAQRNFTNIDELTHFIHQKVEESRIEITIIVMLLVIESSGFRDIYEKYVADKFVKVQGSDVPYILNLRSFISFGLFKSIDLKVANSKLEGNGIVDLLCQATTSTEAL